ncbi:uncharacterized protein LOC119743114 [Patiria miniata]|uniref:Uncharacterized protein n=1 Tax=Patiria miniata TaxID=46514 RepID=A0A914BGK8_PATMI|nr:uncharacterized protein LOC119743114 [Patiria miniata]XP_038075397.1 uncharacterized protein LOC119743114 [Patiria miniata]XP_038075398.1 uncharacterized protein LOC119743114 [Patiria miniata]XP_038075399.1 uncharacterized protein LOC119743114 [Patiria miniata]XP_038075400.1 uncharacterized protein LOC119743114 [Patiria miniata]XP_038075401.1 uncharacterized protein LOC119743114 [Patiria miniata]
MSLKQQLSMIHTSSLKRLTNDSENQSILQELLQHMSEEHTQLLHHHLAQLRLYAQACALSKSAPEESAAESTVLVPDLADQSQDISHMAMMSSSEDSLGNMEQTVVMSITSEEDSEPLGNIVDNPGDTMRHDVLPLDKDIQLSPNDIPYQLTSEGLSPRHDTCESGHVYQSGRTHSHHNTGCDVTQQDFHENKSLKLVLSNSTPKIFCPDGFDKKTFEDMSNEGPPLKCGRTNSLKAI